MIAKINKTVKIEELSQQKEDLEYKIDYILTTIGDKVMLDHLINNLNIEMSNLKEEIKFLKEESKNVYGLTASEKKEVQKEYKQQIAESQIELSAKKKALALLTQVPKLLFV